MWIRNAYSIETVLKFVSDEGRGEETLSFTSSRLGIERIIDTFGRRSCSS
jgi:hypothetical protein